MPQPTSIERLERRAALASLIPLVRRCWSNYPTHATRRVLTYHQLVRALRALMDPEPESWRKHEFGLAVTAAEAADPAAAPFFQPFTEHVLRRYHEVAQLP